MDMSACLKRFVFLWFLFSCSVLLKAQPDQTGMPFIQNFSPQEYEQHPQNWAILQDNRGIIYIGNGNGVIEYDGEEFRLIEITNKATVRSLALGPDNRVFVGSVGEVGYLKPNKEGLTEYVSYLPRMKEEDRQFADIWNTLNNGRSTFFKSYSKLIRVTEDTIQTWNSNNKFSGCFLIGDTFYIHHMDRGLLKYDDDSLVKAPYWKEFFHKNYFIAATSYSKGKAIFNSGDQLHLYNPSAKEASSAVTRFHTDSDEFLRKNKIYTIHRAPKHSFIIGTPLNKGFLIVDSTGKTLQQIDVDQGLQQGAIYDVTSDKEGNAWLAMSNGIAKADISSPITFWDQKANLEGIVEDIIKFNNTLYIATHQGLFYLDGQGKIHQFQEFQQEFWDFVIFQNPDNPNQKRLIVTSRNYIFEIKDNKLHEIHRVKDGTPIFYLYQSTLNPELLYFGRADGISVLKFQNGTFSEEKQLLEIPYNVRSIIEDKHDNLWLGLFRNGAMKLKVDLKKLEVTEKTRYDQKDGFRTTKNILIYPFQDRLLFASDKGFHRYDYKKDRFFPDSTLGTSFGDGSRDVFSFQEMKDGTVWCSGLKNRSGKIGKAKLDDNNNYTWEYKQFRRIPEMMVLAMHAEPDGTLWVGGSEGLFRYTPTPKAHTEKFPTLLRRVTMGHDSVLFAGNSYEIRNKDTFPKVKQLLTLYQKIPYHNNTVTFEFAALTYKGLRENMYSFYLEGYQDNWSSWTDNNFKQYTNLKEGDYVFHVRSKNIYGKEGTPTSYKFTISPPWHRTALAYFSYFTIAGLLFYLGILLNSRRLKAKNKKLENIILERTSEIQEQKDQIEQQKEEITQQRDSIYNQANQLRLINQELKKLTIVARETDNAIIITDPAGNIEWINEGFVRLFGYNIEELRDKFGMNINEGSSVQNVNKIFNKVKIHKTSETYESYVIAKNGEVINTYTTLTPVLDKNGEVEKMIAIDSDIRELKVAEEKLQKLNATKDKFFSIIAHDLKNPFSSLIGASDILINKFDQFDRERKLFFLQNIKKVAKQGYDLLINLLEWARSQTGRIEFEMQELPLDELIKTNLELLRTSANNKHIEIHTNIDPSAKVYADQNTVLTVIRNLLSNAIKYTFKGGKITISSETLDDYIKIHVTDEGTGISEKIQHKLFRIDENYSKKGTNEETGTGLGLILCKEFVEKNQGEIYLESEEGKGSTFSFTLLRSKK